MGKSISSTEKKKRGRGRPRTDPVAQHFTMPRPLSEAIDAWIDKQREPVSRPEAIRRLVEMGLAAEAGSHPPHTKKSAVEAAKLAERQINRMSDQATTSEERQSRKRKLLKGPSEFRDLRKKPSRHR